MACSSVFEYSQRLVPPFFFPIFLALKFSSLNDKTTTFTMYCKTNCRVSRISKSRVHYGLKISSQSHLRAPRESISRIALHSFLFPICERMYSRNTSSSRKLVSPLHNGVKKSEEKRRASDGRNPEIPISRSSRARIFADGLGAWFAN